MKILQTYEDSLLIDTLRTGFDSHDRNKRNSNSILGLEHEPFDRLIRDGCLIGDIKELGWPVFDLRDGICLAYRTPGADDEDKAYDRLWDWPRPENLDPLFSTTVLCAYQGNPVERLDLYEDSTLLTLLPGLLERNREKILTDAPFIGEFAPKENPLSISKWTIRRLSGLENFSGRVTECEFELDGMECGEPMCSSEFAWIKEHICLVYLKGGGDIWHADFFPFNTRDDSRS